MFKKMLAAASMIVFISSVAGYAQPYTGEPSNRVKINLGETPWKFWKGDPNGAQGMAFNDAGWKNVGIPHTWNDTDTYINQASGGGDGSMLGGTNWYRKHFTVDSKYSGRKIFVEFEGAHVGAAVYINGGPMIPGNSAYNPACTHVIGFIGFVVDITSSVNFGGADNVLAVRVAKSGGIYTDPGFSLGFRFGQGDGGLFRPVWMHIKDKVYVPENVYSVLNTWGTYVATTAASPTSATVRIQTNVKNENAAAASVTLTTKIVDATNNVVWTQDAGPQSVGAGATYMFDQTATIANPHLWYPTNSTYGGPYMHKVYHIVKVGGVTLDVAQSPLGIRRITWDANFPYINGQKHLLFGASARYDYPALGTALPPEVEWREAKILTECGGNLWRPGHSSCSPGFVEACDALGVFLIQPSGEGEGAFSTGANPPAARVTLKSELHRDMVIRDRNNPSILAWEASNGDIDPAIADQLRNINLTWDNLTPRPSAVRGGPQWQAGDLIACTVTGCEIGIKNAHPLCPAWGAEAWGRHAGRAAYDREIEFAAEFMQNWRKSIQANCFGLCQWYLGETPGETADFLEGSLAANNRSFGSSMMDFNRFPKMLYKMYAAAWIPYTIKPVVYLAHHWNRAGVVRVNAWSNCPTVKLRLNGADLGNKTPNPWTGVAPNTDLTQTTTQLPFQCYWDNVTWATGILRAEGLNAGGAVVCFDEKRTAGAPACIVLTQDAPIVKPNGEVFAIRANATDAALIAAKVVDAAGNLCPTANNIITFSVTGPGNYRGGTDQFVTAGQPLGYHSPLDLNLSAEGGMCKIAVRSTFTTGTVTVTATATGGLSSCTPLTFTVLPVLSSVSIKTPPSKLQGAASAVPTLKMEMAGNTLRYFTSAPCFIAFEILNANGRVVKQIVGSSQGQGWHVLQPSGSRGNAGNGIYFVRCTANGTSFVKRVFILN
jgi:beta-galactosidase